MSWDGCRGIQLDQDIGPCPITYAYQDMFYFEAVP